MRFKLIAKVDLEINFQTTFIYPCYLSIIMLFIFMQYTEYININIQLLKDTH